jgi:hypothetical protein
MNIPDLLFHAGWFNAVPLENAPLSSASHCGGGRAVDFNRR